MTIALLLELHRLIYIKYNIHSILVSPDHSIEFQRIDVAVASIHTIFPQINHVDQKFILDSMDAYVS
jgi:hypothetical protein